MNRPYATPHSVANETALCRGGFEIRPYFMSSPHNLEPEPQFHLFERSST